MRLPLLLSALCGLLALPARAAPPTYAVVQTFAVGGEGFWDYPTFDPSGARLFLSHQDRVVVLSAKDGKRLGEIDGLQGVHGIVVAPRLGRGFISDGRAGAVVEFDLKTLKRLADIPVTGKNPDAIVYEPKHQRVITFNGGSSNATFIDAKSGKVVATLALPGRPEFAVASPSGRVYLNLEDVSKLAELDVAVPRVVAIWPLSSCEGPSGLALDARGHRLFSVCGNGRMAITDARNGKQLATVPIGNGPDGAAYAPGSHLAFSPNGRDGTLTVVSTAAPDRYPVVQTVQTQVSARTITLDPATGRVFLPAATLGPRPAPTAQNPHPRPAIEPGSFRVLVVAPVK